MEVLPYRSEMLPGVVALYNRATAPVPHCYRVREETFSGGFMNLSEGREDKHRLDKQEMLVAREKGEVAGFIHAAFTDGQASDGAIRFFAYERGRREAGQKLLDAGQAWLREGGATRIHVFPQELIYPFYHIECAYLSDRMDHVQALLGMNGYRRARGEVFLDWPGFEKRDPRPTEINVIIEIERKERGGARPDVVVVPRLNGQVVGNCTNGSESLRTGNAEGDEWFFTHLLWVNDELQGRGLGRHLLQIALNEAYDIGYRNAAISTAWDNYRAFVFYSHFGYHVSDWTYGYANTPE